MNKLILVTLAALLSLRCNAETLPNMLFFIADDLGYADTEPYGSVDAVTPNVAALAKQGLRFNNAYVNSPSCAPSRAALFTALRSQRNGVEANHDYTRFEGVIHALDGLKRKGYEIAAFGKIQHGSHKRDPWDHGIEYHGSPKINYGEIERYLQRRNEQRPLLLMVGSRPPHVPWPLDSSFDDSKLTLPAKSVDTKQTRINFSQYLEDVKTMDTHLGTVKALFEKYVPGTDKVTLFTSDHGAQWPFGKWNLYDTGVKVPLIISWPGTIKPGKQSEAMVSWIDLIPTLTDIAGSTIEHDVDGRSFLKTLENPQLAHRDQLFLTHTGDGSMNVYPMRAIRTARFKYIKNLHPEFIHLTHQTVNVYMNHNLFWPGWLDAAQNNPKAYETVSALQARAPEELYDLEKDPHETRNLYRDPAHHKELIAMRTRLAEAMAQSKDKEPVVAKPIRLIDCYLKGCDTMRYEAPPPKNKKNKAP